MLLKLKYSIKKIDAWLKTKILQLDGGTLYYRY